MERLNEVETSPIGLRQEILKKYFTVAIRPMLTACSYQDICSAFPSFTTSEQEYLHRLYIKVVTSLHGNIEDEFESICLEQQVGTILDTVEQLVEERELNSRISDKTNVVDVAQSVSAAKKNEVKHLKNMLRMAEEQNRLIRARVEVLKKGATDASIMSDTVEKLRRGNSNYGLHSDGAINNQ